MILSELKDKRNKLMTDAAQLLQAETVTAEMRTSANAMLADVDTIESDITNLERIAKHEADQRSIIVPPRPQPGDMEDRATMSKEERHAGFLRAFRSFARTGRIGDNDRAHARMVIPFEEQGTENRELLTTSDTTGGAFVAQEFSGLLEDAQKFYGPVSTLVGQKRTNNNGAPLKVSFSDDTANSGTYLTEGGTQPSEVDPSVVSHITNTDIWTSNVVTVSMAELADSAFDIDSWLRFKFGQRFARRMEQDITKGNSSNLAALTSVAGSVVVTATGGSGSGQTGANSIDYDDITALYGKLDAAYQVNASWLMNTNTRAYLMGVKDSYGRPLYIPNPTSGAFDTLLGRPVVLDQALDSIASAKTTILFGDLQQGYLFRTDGDVQIIRYNELFAGNLSVGFQAFCRVGGLAIAPNASNPPIVNLLQATAS